MARKAKQTAAPSSMPDASTPRAHHRLAGLEPDNLLAVMALLGLLRALETARPDWQPRAFWDVKTHPLRPILTLAAPETEAAVAEAAAQGVRAVLGPVSKLCTIAAQQEPVNIKKQIEETEHALEAAKREGKQTGKLTEQLKKLRKREKNPKSPKKIARIASTAVTCPRFQGHS